MKRLVLLILLTSAFVPSQWAVNDYANDDLKLYRYLINADGQEKELYSVESSIDKILKDEQITLAEDDSLNVQFSDDTFFVKIVRPLIEVVSELEEIPFDRETQNSFKITKGFSKKIQEGQPGLKKVKYQVTYREGVEVSREVISEQILKNPKPEILLKGQRTKVAISSGRPTNAKDVLVMEASAYTHTGNRTFTGVYPEVGTIAVDPEVIPLGTKVWIEGYGFGVAQDTGGYIKGKRIDLFMETKRECLSWGRRHVRVLILE
ncbi:MAG: 3D domain-containing protein [Bacillota bacterium]